MIINGKDFSLFLVAGIFVIASLVSPIHDFNLWSQVTELRQKGGVGMGHAHYLRYILVLPIFLLSDYTGLNADFLFQFFCFFMLFIIVRNCSNILVFYIRGNIQIGVFVLGLFFLGLSMFMNGRMIFSLVGFSYLTLLMHKWNYFQLGDLNFFLRIPLALFFCSVSTGVFLLCVSCILVFSLLPQIRKKSYFYYLYTVVIISALSNLILLYLFKNINFYGGGFDGFVNMLRHGPGIIFLEYGFGATALIFLNFLLVATLFMLTYFNTFKYRILLLLSFVGSICGLYGYSTLSMTLIPLILLSMTLLLIRHETVQKH